jgi:hypothetical protein
MFYKKPSYILNDLTSEMDIHFQIKKILKQINRQRLRDITTIYIRCKSYDNISKSNMGLYDFYSTNSIKHLSSQYNINLIGLYLIKELNETIYEFVPSERYYNTNYYNTTNNIKYICEILCQEIEKDLYKEIRTLE